MTTSTASFSYWEERAYGEKKGLRVENVRSKKPFGRILDWDFCPSEQYQTIKALILEQKDPLVDRGGIWQISGNRVNRFWGMPDAKFCPADMPPEKMSADLDRRAEKWKIHHYFRVTDAADCRRQLEDNRPVVVSIDLSRNLGGNCISALSLARADVAFLTSRHRLVLESYNAETGRFAFCDSKRFLDKQKIIGDIPADLLDRCLYDGWGQVGPLPTPTLNNKEGLACLLWKSDDLGRSVYGREIVDAATGTSIAWAFAVCRDRYLDIEEFFVWPDFRRRGHGKKLAEMLLELGEEVGRPLRYWTPFVDCASSNREAMQKTLAAMKLHLHPSPVRWAGFMAIPEPSPFIILETIVPQPPALLQQLFAESKSITIKPIQIEPGRLSSSRNRPSEEILTSGPFEEGFPGTTEVHEYIDERSLGGIEGEIVADSPWDAYVRGDFKDEIVVEGDDRETKPSPDWLKSIIGEELDFEVSPDYAEIEIQIGSPDIINIDSGVTRSSNVVAGPEAAPLTKEGETVQLWFGTNRKPLGDPLRFASEFANVIDPDLKGQKYHRGECGVWVPHHHIFGETGSTGLRAVWKNLIGEDDQLILQSVVREEEEEFWAAVRKKIQGSSDKQSLIFIHGYNVSFEDAAIRAAQLHKDLKISGATAFFSWPSAKQKKMYFKDCETIEISEGAVARFILDFIERSEAETVHLLAHSMGNRGLLRALNKIYDEVKRKSPKKIGEIILAAPDVNVDLFKQLAAILPDVSRRTTLYASPADKALGFSRFFNKYPRAGHTPPVTIVPKVDTIVVPKFNLLDLLDMSHSYFAEAGAVLHDIFDLLAGMPADKRQRLDFVEERHCWEMNR